MEVTESLSNWLKSFNLLKYPLTLSSDGIFLHDFDSKLFETGQNFIPLLQKLQRLFPTASQKPIPSIPSTSDTLSPAAKLYNWNLIIKCLDSLHLSIDSDMKALIVAGDRQLITEILHTLYTLDTSPSPEAPGVPFRKQKKRNKVLAEGALFLDELDPGTPLLESESTLEFLILSLCQEFSLSCKLAAGLLAQSGKVLSQVLTKGLKGNIDPVIAWYRRVVEHSGFLGELMAKERGEGAVALVLGAVKPGLAARDYSVVQRCCEALAALNTSLAAKEINTWEWFVVDALGMAFKAYDCNKEDVTTYILKLLLAFGRNNLREVFGQLMIDNYPDTVQCFSIISSFWGHIGENTQAHRDIQEQGLIEFWVDFGLRQAEIDETSVHNTRVAAIGFLCDIWCKFSAHIEKHEDSANSILTVIKRACREKSRILKVICYGRLFHLLSVFSKLKNTYAPIIYKTLTFALVESYANDRIREFFLNNFLYVMEEIQNLPLSIMLEPYLKQALVMKKPRHNTADFDYFVAVARHPKLAVRDAILIIDYLGKIYYNDPIYANSAEIPLVLILGRFIKAAPVQDFVVKFVNIGLKLILSSLPSKQKIRPREITSKEELEEKKMIRYYKHLVFNVSEKILQLGNNEVNVEVQNLLVSAYFESGYSLKSIKGILSLLGDANAMIQNYEAGRFVVDVIRNGPEGHTSNNSSMLSGMNNPGTVSVVSQPMRNRAMSEIERVRRIRVDKKQREQSQSDIRKAAEAKQKVRLRYMLDQRKIQHGVESALGSSRAGIFAEVSIVVDFCYYLIEEEADSEQEIIWTLLSQYRKVFKSLFTHYSSSGFKKLNANKPSFESLLEKKTTISEAEISKMLRDHSIATSSISTEELKKLIAWFLQKKKVQGIDCKSFGQVLYYISSNIYSAKKYNAGQYPFGASLMLLMNQFKQSPSRLVPKGYYEEFDAGAGDKEVISVLSARLQQNPEFPMPEGYVSAKEKIVEVLYQVPDHFNMPHRVSLEVLDEILFQALQVHLLRPALVVKTITRVKGLLNRPRLKERLDLEDKPGVPNNKAEYKVQPLPGYLNFYPGIKLEVARLAPDYSSELVLECARALDDLIYSVDSKAFCVISKNPRPAGSIANKILQERYDCLANEINEKKKSEAERRLRKKIVEMKLARDRNLKQNLAKDEEEMKAIEVENEKENQRKAKELKIAQKMETETKLQEYKLRKEEEKKKKIEEEQENDQKTNEAKKKSREEFLKIAKKKLLDSMALKKEIKQKAASEVELTRKSTAQKKIFQRKFLMKQIQDSKAPIQQEKNHKEQVYMAMIDPGAKDVISMYTPGIEVVFAYFCKQSPLSTTDFSQLSLPGFTKFTTQFPIVPVLVTSEEILKIYKRITKKKTSESGITLREFIESLISIALLSISKLQNDIGKKLDTYATLVQEFFDWIGLPKEAMKGVDFLKRLSLNMSTMNNRDKLKRKNTLVRTLKY